MYEHLRNAIDRAALSYFTRDGSPLRPVFNASIPASLANGSGEPMMTRNLQGLLRKYGIKSTYAPDGGYLTWLRDEYGTTIGDLPGNGSRFRRLMNNPAFRGRNVGKDSLKGFYEKFKKLSPTEKRKLFKAINSGRFDHISPGRLRDFLLLDSSIIKNPKMLAADGTLKNLAESGKAKMFMNTFRGFSPYGWELPPGYVTHKQNWYDADVGGLFNLGREANFRANYNGNAKKVIPATSVYDNPLNRNGISARISHAIDRRFVEKNILSANPGAKLRGKKIIFMDSGSQGPNNTSKILDLVDSVKGRNDVHILMQTGGDAFAKDLKDVISSIKKDNPGLLTTVDRFDKGFMGRLVNGSDLHVTYGGSSSAGEAGSHLTPTIFTTDGELNLGNSKFVERMRNLYGGNRISHLDNHSTGIYRELERIGAIDKGVVRRKMSPEEIDQMLTSLSNRSRLGMNEGHEIARRILEDPRYIDAVRQQNKQKINDMLGRKIQNGRYSKGTIGSMRRFINNSKDSNREFVDITKREIFRGLGDMDKARSDRVRTLLRDVVRNGSKASDRVAALRKLMSLQGARDVNLTLGRFLTGAKGPIRSRLAVPLALASIVGAGGAAAASMKRK